MNTQRMYLHSVTTRESLRHRRVSEAGEQGARGRNSPSSEGGISNVLQSLLNFKLEEAQDHPIIGHLRTLGMTAGTGLHPEIVAEITGFDSGDAMVRALAAAKPPSEAITELTDAPLRWQTRLSLIPRVAAW